MSPVQKCDSRAASHQHGDDHRDGSGVTSAPPGTIYTCPMHPHIRQERPGNCPICGMALEPLIATSELVCDLELVEMSRRFWIGVALAIPVVLLGMGGDLFAMNRFVSGTASAWIQLAFATPVAWWAGWPFFTRAAASVVSRNLNMFTLIALGTGVAWTYSVAATLFPYFLPATFRHGDYRVRRMDDLGARASLHLCAPCRCERPNHRMPMRIGTCHSNVHHGGRWTGSAGRCPHQKRRSA